MTEQMPDLGVGRATSGVKASFERIMAWAKKNPALVVAIIAGVVILALLMKRKQPAGRVAKPREGNGDPLGGIGAGVPGPEGVPEAEEVGLPIPTTPPAPSTNGVETTLPYIPQSTILSEIVTSVVKVKQGPGQYKHPERAGPSKVELQKRIGRGPMAGWTGLELMRVARGDPRHNVPVKRTIPRYPTRPSRPAISRRGPSSRRGRSPSRRGPSPAARRPSSRERGRRESEAARRRRNIPSRGGRR
jgi:hypothetical protein